jgi:hypothetical protein
LEEEKRRTNLNFIETIVSKNNLIVHHPAFCLQKTKNLYDRTTIQILSRTEKGRKFNAERGKFRTRIIAPGFQNVLIGLNIAVSQLCNLIGYLYYKYFAFGERWQNALLRRLT